MQVERDRYLRVPRWVSRSLPLASRLARAIGSLLHPSSFGNGDQAPHWAKAEMLRRVGSSSVERSADVEWNLKISFCDPTDTSSADETLVQAVTLFPADEFEIESWQAESSTRRNLAQRLYVMQHCMSCRLAKVAA